MKVHWKLTLGAAVASIAFAAVAYAQDGLLPPSPASPAAFNLFQDEDPESPNGTSPSDIDTGNDNGTENGADPDQTGMPDQGDPDQGNPDQGGVTPDQTLPYLPDAAFPMDEMPEMEEEEEEECEEECPVRLFNTCGCIDIYGHMSFGYYDNSEGTNNGVGNQPLGFRNVADGATFDQYWLTVEKALDDCCPSWGFRVDYIFGADGPDTTAFGDQSKFDFRWQSSRDYGSAMPQLYAQYGTSDFNVKVGHFYTIIGYEVVAAPDNFFYSHAYTMYYGEPFTHTGVLTESSLMCDQLTVWAGWTNGWDSYFGDHLNASTFLGGASYSVNDCLAVTYATVWGDHGDGTARRGVASNQGDIYMHSVVVDYQINECLQYVFQSDYANNRVNGTHEEWYGVNQYLFYTLSDCYKVGARFEWFNDADGVRIINSDVNETGIGNDVDYYAITLGLNYTPNCNLIVRPEIRWDWAEGGTPFAPVAGIGTEDNQFYYGLDVIVLY